MGEFSEAHLGSAAAQKGSVGGRGWASRSGPPKGCFEVTVLALAECWGGRAGPRAPRPQCPATGPWAPGLVDLPWVPGRGGTCRVPDMTGRRQGSGVGGWARWFSCIHGRMSSGLSGRSLGSPGLACLLACLLACSLSLCLSHTLSLSLCLTKFNGKDRRSPLTAVLAGSINFLQDLLHGPARPSQRPTDRTSGLRLTGCLGV